MFFLARPRPRSVATASLIAAALVAGCGGARVSKGHAGTHVKRADTRYTVGALGAGWSEVALDREESDVAWADPAGSVIQVSARCEADLDIPLEALTLHLLIGFTEREMVGQARIPLDAREALRTRVRAKLDGVPRELDLVVLKKNECVYDFALVGAPGQGVEAARGAFEALLAGFTTEGRRP